LTTFKELQTDVYCAYSAAFDFVLPTPDPVAHREEKLRVYV
jgi:hypothetical protein